MRRLCWRLTAELFTMPLVAPPGTDRDDMI